MKKGKAIIIIALCIVFTAGLAAQDLLTPESAVSKALEHNYGILLAKKDSTAGAIDLSYTNSVFLPRINVSTGTTWNYNNQKQTFSDGTQRGPQGVRSGNLTGSLEVDWTLFDGMKMFITRKKLNEIWATGEILVKAEIVNTAAEVMVIYYNIVRQKQQMRAIDEQIAVIEERVKVAERKLRTGLGSKPELLQAKVDLNAQKANKLQQQTLTSQLKKQLNLLAGMQLPDDFEVVDDIPFNSSLDLKAIENDITSGNPELLLTEKNIQIAELTLDEFKADRYPTVAFRSSYNLSRFNNKSVVNPFQPLTSRNLGFNFGLTASIPILNHRIVRQNIDQATLDIDYLKLAYQDQQNMITTEVQIVFKDYEYQKQALLLEEDNIELAKENLAIALERFRQGVSTYLELREAQKSLEEGYNRLIAARYNAKVSEIELMRLRGAL